MGTTQFKGESKHSPTHVNREITNSKPSITVSATKKPSPSSRVSISNAAPQPNAPSHSKLKEGTAIPPIDELVYQLRRDLDGRLPANEIDSKLRSLTVDTVVKDLAIHIRDLEDGKPPLSMDVHSRLLQLVSFNENVTDLELWIRASEEPLLGSMIGCVKKCTKLAKLTLKTDNGIFPRSLLVSIMRTNLTMLKCGSANGDVAQFLMTGKSSLKEIDIDSAFLVSSESWETKWDLSDGVGVADWSRRFSGVCHLHRITLRSCGLGDEFAGWLGKYLSTAVSEAIFVDLSDNKITEHGLESLLGNLGMNRDLHLNLSQNIMGIVPVSYVWYVDHVTLNVTNNRGMRMPEAIVNDPNRFRQHWLDMKEGYSEITTRRLYVVGHGAAGKTTLIRALNGQPHFIRSLETWSCNDVCDWIRNVKIPVGVVETFVRFGVDGRRLVLLNAADLVGMGINKRVANAVLTFREELQSSNSVIKESAGGMYSATIGINQTVLNFGASSSGGTGKVMTWDFAGQMQYLVSHELFLSDPNAVFVIVGDATGCQQQPFNKQLSYWLSFLASSTGQQDLPVAVVATHLDRFRAEHVNSWVKMYRGAAFDAWDIVKSHKDRLLTVNYSATVATSSDEKSTSNNDDVASVKASLAGLIEGAFKDRFIPRSYNDVAEILSRGQTIRETGAGSCVGLFSGYRQDILAS